MSIFGNMRAAARKRADYNRTVREIEGLTDREAHDLGISRSDARQIAWTTVYGH